MPYPVSATQLNGQVGRLWQHAHTMESGMVLAVQLLGQARIVLVAIDPQGDALALATSAGSIFCLYLQRNRYTLLDEAGKSPLAATFMARTTRRLFVAFTDHSVACYDVSSSAQLARIAAAACCIVSLATRASSDQLATATVDGIALWNAGSMRQQRLLPGAPHGTVQVSFSADETTLVAATSSGTFTMWDAKRQRLIGQFSARGCVDAPGFGVLCFTISPDSRLLLAGCQSNLLLVFDLHARQLMYSIELRESAYGVAMVQFLPDSRHVAGGFLFELLRTPPLRWCPLPPYDREEGVTESQGTSGLHCE